ncbi:MAG: hypothetical protein ACI8S6_001894, partial [Myxococcota bacterium]
MVLCMLLWTGCVYISTDLHEQRRAELAQTDSANPEADTDTDTDTDSDTDTDTDTDTGSLS